MIRSKLAALRALDPDLEVIGAPNHTYRLFPPIDPEVLQWRESALDIELPQEYRRFLLEIGDGPAGPGYGLLTLADALQESAQEFTWEALHKDSPITTDIVRPTPDEIEDIYRSPPWTHGRLIISELGCCETLELIVRGPARGSIWHQAFPCLTGFYKVANDFTRWYDFWLEDSLNGGHELGRERFGPDLDESSLSSWQF